MHVVDGENPHHLDSAHSSNMAHISHERKLEMKAGLDAGEILKGEVGRNDRSTADSKISGSLKKVSSPPSDVESNSETEMSSSSDSESEREREERQKRRQQSANANLARSLVNARKNFQSCLLALSLLVRIKKIMQTDKDIGKIAMVVPVLDQKLWSYSCKIHVSDLRGYMQKGAKTINSTHLKVCVHSFNVFDFLRGTVSDVPELSRLDTVSEERSGTKRRKISKHENYGNEGGFKMISMVSSRVFVNAKHLYSKTTIVVHALGSHVWVIHLLRYAGRVRLGHG